MFLDRQYVVRDGEIVIVDEFTGRLGEGRKWRAGIHQAVEAKEDVEITFATRQAARITVQDFFLRYNRLAGMTGTASTSAPRAAQNLHLPRRCPSRRTARRSARSCRRSSSARPTRSGRRSSKTSSSSTNSAGRCSSARGRSTRASYSRRLLDGRGIEHTVLNARHVEKEAEIVAAGRPAGQSHGRHEHGRPRHRHPARRRRHGAGRPARDLHRAARVAAHRPPAHRPLRPARRPRHVPPVPRAGRRDPRNRLRPEESSDASRSTASRSPAAAPSAASTPCSTKPNAKSNAATSATARCCSTTKRNAKKCSGKWGRIRISTPRANLPRDYWVASWNDSRFLNILLGPAILI